MWKAGGPSADLPVEAHPQRLTAFGFKAFGAWQNRSPSCRACAPRPRAARAAAGAGTPEERTARKGRNNPPSATGERNGTGDLSRTAWTSPPPRVHGAWQRLVLWARGGGCARGHSVHPADRRARRLLKGGAINLQPIFETPASSRERLNDVVLADIPRRDGDHRRRLSRSDGRSPIWTRSFPAEAVAPTSPSRPIRSAFSAGGGRAPEGCGAAGRLFQ